MPTPVDRLAAAVLPRFRFLVDQGFEVTRSGLNHEVRVCFRRRSIEVQVILEIPDTPVVSIKRFEGRRIAKELNLRLPRRGPTRHLVMAYEAVRDTRSIDSWGDYFRGSQFGDLVVEFVEAYAREVEAMLPDLLRERIGPPASPGEP